MAFLVCCTLKGITSLWLFGQISWLMLSKTFFWEGVWEQLSQIEGTWILGTLASSIRGNNMHVPVRIQMIIYNYSLLVKDTGPPSWREAIQRPVWQEEQTHLQWSKAYLHLDQGCAQAALCTLSHYVVDSKCLIEQRQQSEPHEWKHRNTVHISSLNVWNWKWKEPPTMVAKDRTFSTDRRYSAASYPGLITEGRALFSALLSFSLAVSLCVISSFHHHLSL